MGLGVPPAPTVTLIVFALLVVLVYALYHVGSSLDKANAKVEYNLYRNIASYNVVIVL